MTPIEIGKAVHVTLEVCHELLSIIEATGQHGFPSSHLYARLMGHISLDRYEWFIGLLKQSGRVVEWNHCLWTRENAPDFVKAKTPDETAIAE